MNPALIRRPVPALQPSPVRLGCAQVWSGNRDGSTLLELPGLTAWVYSMAAGPGKAGGDVHYVSVCPRCVVSRIALADVSGHGEAVAAFGDYLSELMRRYLGTLKQIPLMRDLSEAVREELGDEHYATMAAVGWHGRWGVVSMTNAGHPPPLWYSAARKEWSWLETECASEQTRRLDLPLGLVANVAYDALVIKAEPGDLLVLYSDGASEALDPAGNELGRSGLMNLVRSLDCSSAERFGIQLVSALDRFRGSAGQQDDQTIIVARRNDVRAGVWGM